MTSYDKLLISHHHLNTTILHTNDIPGIKFEDFAITLKFHPTGLSELRNRNIVIGGPTHLCDFSKCKINDCELVKNSSGLLHVFSTRKRLSLRDFGHVDFSNPYCFKF